MGRMALVTADHVQAAVEALRADGMYPTARAVHEKLGNVGSMGTVHKLLHRCLSEKEGGEASLRQLPPELQQVILAFADDLANSSRKQIADELLSSREEAADLAADNEQLTDVIAELRNEVSRSASEKAAVEGRVAQLLSELAGARDEVIAERRSAEEARLELAKLRVQLEATAPLVGELRASRDECESQRLARANAEQATAVLEAQKHALESRLADLTKEQEFARAACERLDARARELAEIVEREREKRTAAEREFAVLVATTDDRAARPHTKARKERGQQTPLWQGDGPEGAGPDA